MADDQVAMIENRYSFTRVVTGLNDPLRIDSEPPLDRISEVRRSEPRGSIPGPIQMDVRVPDMLRPGTSGNIREYMDQGE